MFPSECKDVALSRGEVLILSGRPSHLHSLFKPRPRYKLLNSRGLLIRLTFLLYLIFELISVKIVEMILP